MGIYPDMAFMDYIWLIKLIIELLKVLGGLSREDQDQISKGVKLVRDMQA